jgi:hypothetical protein
LKEKWDPPRGGVFVFGDEQQAKRGHNLKTPFLALGAKAITEKEGFYRSSESAFAPQAGFQQTA